MATNDMAIESEKFLLEVLQSRFILNDKEKCEEFLNKFKGFRPETQNVVKKYLEKWDKFARNNAKVIGSTLADIQDETAKGVHSQEECDMLMSYCIKMYMDTIANSNNFLQNITERKLNNKDLSLIEKIKATLSGENKTNKGKKQKPEEAGE